MVIAAVNTQQVIVNEQHESANGREQASAICHAATTDQGWPGSLIMGRRSDCLTMPG